MRRERIVAEVMQETHLAVWRAAGAFVGSAVGGSADGWLWTVAARRPVESVPPPRKKIWADQGFPGRIVEWSRTIVGRELEIVRKAPDQRGFQVQPKRWVVERTFSWLTAHRRLARDYETSPARSETMIRRAMIGVMVRRLARGRPATRPGPRASLRDVS